MIKPIGKRVVIKRIPVEEKTSSGIVIPSASKEKTLKAEVLAVGSEVNEIQAGDRILFKKYAGTDFKIDGEEIAIVELEDILAVFE